MTRVVTRVRRLEICFPRSVIISLSVVIVASRVELGDAGSGVPDAVAAAFAG